MIVIACEDAAAFKTTCNKAINQAVSADRIHYNQILGFNLRLSVVKPRVVYFLRPAIEYLFRNNGLSQYLEGLHEALTEYS